MNNREIKFRAWDDNNNSMIIAGEPRAYGVVTNEYILRHYDYDDVMQYTGLKDKNGKEIYEGDVVNLKGVHESNEGTYRVRFFMGSPILAMGLKHVSFISIKDQFLEHTNKSCITANNKMLCMEKKGNIYENPDMIGQ